MIDLIKTLHLHENNFLIWGDLFTAAHKSYQEHFQNAHTVREGEGTSNLGTLDSVIPLFIYVLCFIGTPASPAGAYSYVWRLRYRFSGSMGFLAVEGMEFLERHWGACPFLSYFQAGLLQLTRISFCMDSLIPSWTGCYGFNTLFAE